MTVEEECRRMYLVGEIGGELRRRGINPDTGEEVNAT